MVLGYIVDGEHYCYEYFTGKHMEQISYVADARNSKAIIACLTTYMSKT